MEKNILVTGAGKGIGKKILFDCIDQFNFVYAVIRKKNDFIKIKKVINNDKCRLYLGDINNLNLIEKILSDSKKIKKKLMVLLIMLVKDKERIFLRLTKLN